MKHPMPAAPQYFDDNDLPPPYSEEDQDTQEEYKNLEEYKNNLPQEISERETVKEIIVFYNSKRSPNEIISFINTLNHDQLLALMKNNGSVCFTYFASNQNENCIRALLKAVKKNKIQIPVSEGWPIWESMAMDNLMKKSASLVNDYLEILHPDLSRKLLQNEKAKEIQALGDFARRTWFVAQIKKPHSVTDSKFKRDLLKSLANWLEADSEGSIDAVIQAWMRDDSRRIPALMVHRDCASRFFNRLVKSVGISGFLPASLKLVCTLVGGREALNNLLVRPEAVCSPPDYACRSPSSSSSC